MSEAVSNLERFKEAKDKGFSNEFAARVANGEGRALMADMVAQMDNVTFLHYINHNASIQLGDEMDAQCLVYVLLEGCAAEHLDARTINEAIACLMLNASLHPEETHSHLITQEVITEAMELSTKNPSCQNHAFWAKLTSKIYMNEQGHGAIRHHDQDDLQMAVLRLLDNPAIDEKYPFWQSYTKSLADQGRIFLSGPALSKLNAGDAHAPSTGF